MDTGLEEKTIVLNDVDRFHLAQYSVDCVPVLSCWLYQTSGEE